MRQPVSPVLELLDVAHPLVGPVGEVVQETDEALRDLDGVRRAWLKRSKNSRF